MKEICAFLVCLCTEIMTFKSGINEQNQRNQTINGGYSVQPLISSNTETMMTRL